MQISEFEQLLYTVKDGVATLQLNRPQVRNAFSARLYGELKWGVRRAEVDPDVEVIVVTGDDKAFAVGGDLKESLAAIQDEDPLALTKFTDNLPWMDMRDCHKPIIASIRGYCYAGGLITAAWCDISIAADTAQLALTEGKVGMVDAMAPSVLFGRVPTSKLKYMLLTAQPISAPEAERIGLITESVPEDQLDARVEEIIGFIKNTSPVARRLFKQYVNELVPRPLNHGGTAAHTSDTIIEGLSAFSGKRPPDYGGFTS